MARPAPDPAGAEHGAPSLPREMLGRFLHGLPAVLLLTLLTVVVHATHAFDSFDSWFVRHSVRLLLAAQHSDPAADEVPVRKGDANAIQVIQASTWLRVRALEHDGKDLEQAELDRVGGVRPMDRARLAALINALATALPSPAVGAAPRVVAIDIDVAPLLAGCSAANPQSRAAQTPIHDALNALREKAHVIVIALSRPDLAQRICRNTFMARARCTTTENWSAAGQLHFASPRLFHAHDDYALKYPFDAAAAGDPFPGLGNLIHLRLHDRNDAKHMSALTALCREATAAGGALELLEDRVEQGGLEPGKVEYKWRRLNWKLLDDDRIRSTVLSKDEVQLDRDDRIVALHPLAPGVLDSRVIILGVDGGLRHDRFDAAAATPDPVSGALMHALVALSSDEPVYENESIAFAFDALIGMGFVAAWAILAVLLARVAAASTLTGTVGWLAAAMPILLALGIGWIAMNRLSPLALERWSLWANPAYVLGGLVLHAYLEAWRETWPDVKVHHPHLPDFSFGAGRLSRGRGSFDDALIALFGVVVAITGIVLLFSHGEEHGPWAAAATAALCLLSFHVHRRREA